MYTKLVFTSIFCVLNSLSAGSETGITLTPKAGLTAGIYIATLTVSGESMTPVSVVIVYTVNPTANDVITQSLLQAWTVGGTLHVSGLTAFSLFAP